MGRNFIGPFKVDVMDEPRISPEGDVFVTFRDHDDNVMGMIFENHALIDIVARLEMAACEARMGFAMETVATLRQAGPAE